MLALTTLFVREHELTQTAAAIIQAHARPDHFSTPPQSAAEWRYCIGLLLADDLTSQGLTREAYILRLHATEIEGWHAAMYSAWLASIPEQPKRPQAAAALRSRNPSGSPTRRPARQPART